MDVRLGRALAPVKAAVSETAHKAASRRLTMYGQEVPCKPGCSGCCSRLVPVTVAEAVIIYERLVSDGTWKEVGLRAREQWRDASTSQRLSWFKSNRKCPVLDPATNRCLAYGVRPTFCSTHFVTSSPELCEPWSTASGEFKPLDFDDLNTEFRTKLMEVVSAFGILGYEMPLPTALLFAERISVQTGMDFHDLLSLMLQELGG